ncbi:MAG: alpha-mannosidase, partial [Ignavibacteriales bacterium]|nr:alpha-mannosidase [Ignavibacteriales bacterium]
SHFRRMEIIEKGPVRIVLRLYRDYLKPGTKKEFPTEDFPSSFFTQDIILYNGIDRVDFKTDVDWWEEKTFLKVAFPLAVSDTAATYEIPYGTIRRSTQLRDSWEKAKVEVPAQRWADVSQNGYGVSLLNRSKYGYDIKGNTIRLSLLRSPKWPDPTADRGKHSIEYSLYPHKGNWKDANTVQRGYEYNYPLVVTTTDAHKGKLPEAKSFVELSPSNLVLTTIKKAEDSNAWVVQWYDAEGKDTEGTLTFPQAPKKIVTSNFLEADGTPIEVTKNSAKIRTKKNSVVTVKVYF